MGRALEIKDMLINRQYDLHGVKLAYAKALDCNDDPAKLESLRLRILLLKEEIRMLSELLRFPRLNN